MSLLPDAHPDANLLSAFAGGLLRGAERDTVLSHLADCDACRRVAFLVQATDRDDSLDEQRFRSSAHRTPRPLRRFTGIAASVTCVIGFALSSFYRAERISSPHRHAIVAETHAFGGASLDSKVASAQRSDAHTMHRRRPARPRKALQPSGSFVRMPRVRLSYKRLIDLPELLPALPAPRPLALRKAPEISNATTIFLALELPNHYESLKPVPTLSIGNLPTRNWSSTCETNEVHSVNSSTCAPLYQKAGLQLMALTLSGLPEMLDASTISTTGPGLRWPSVKRRSNE
jgi:hypothetical protein